MSKSSVSVASTGRRSGLGKLSAKFRASAVVLSFLKFHRFQTVKFGSRLWGLGGGAARDALVSELGCGDAVTDEALTCLVNLINLAFNQFASYVGVYYFKSYVKDPTGAKGKVIPIEKFASRCPDFVKLFMALQAIYCGECEAADSLHSTPFIGFAITPSLTFKVPQGWFNAHSKPTTIAIPGVHATKFGFDLMNNCVFVTNSKQRINTEDDALPPFETPAVAVGANGDDIVNPFFEVYLDINDFGVDGAIHFRPIETQEAEEPQPVDDSTARSATLPEEEGTDCSDNPMSSEEEGERCE